MSDTVIELHVMEDDRNVQRMLQTFCDENRIEIIRLFWRGLEPDDKEALAQPVYEDAIPEYGDLISVKDFRDACVSALFIDYDGTGNPAKPVNAILKCDRNYTINPSEYKNLPEDATHIVWYNK